MTSREIGFSDALAIVPIVGVILVLAFYPQFVLKRTQPSANAAVAGVQSQIVTVASR